MGGEPGAASFIGNPLGWERILGSLGVRALPLSSGDAAGGGYSCLGAENLRGLPDCPGWFSKLSGSAVHVSRSPAPLVGVEVYENQEVVSIYSLPQVDKGCLV